MGVLWAPRIALALGAIGLLWLEQRRRGGVTNGSIRLWIICGWLVLAAAGVGTYYRFSSEALLRGTDAYDLVHYYVNAKYFRELGYTRLYEACLVADSEGRNEMADLEAIRDLRDQRVRHRDYIRDIRRHPEEVKRRFSPRRWREFVDDLTTLQRDVDLRKVLLDRGYNATPAWHLLGHLLASRVPTKHLALLTRVDLLLVVAMFAVVAWAYGLRVALIAILWFSVSFSSTWPTVGWSLLRYDWLAAAVTGICMVGRGRRLLGGALLGWAALSRIFPGVLLVFLLVRAAHRLIFRHVIDRDAASIAAGFLFVLAVGVGVTSRVSEPGQISAFRHDLAIHLENLSVNRMGVGVALAYRGEVSKTQMSVSDRRRRFAQAGRLGPLGQVIGFVWLAIAALSVVRQGRRRSGRPTHSDDDLLQLGFLGFALLLTASFYYWSLRLLAVLLHARHSHSSRWDRGGLAALFLIEIWSLGWHVALRFQYGLIATTSIWMTAYAAATCLVRARSALSQRSTGPPKAAGLTSVGMSIN